MKGLKMGHEPTPAPWTIERGNEIFAGDQLAITFGVGNDINAKHIVRCVNSHDDLLAACKAMRAALIMLGASEEALLPSTEAIQKAES